MYFFYFTARRIYPYWCLLFWGFIMLGGKVGEMPSWARWAAGPLAAISLCVGAAGPASAVDSRTIKLVLPAPPGGAGDIVARLLAEQVGHAEHQSIVIESKPGAGTLIGTETVVRSAPDGNTLLINAPFLLIGPHMRKWSIDPLKDLQPLCYLVSSPGLIAVNEASPYRTLEDLINAAKTKPGELSVGAVGPGTTHQIGLAKLKRAANADLLYVPFTGGGPAITAALGNHVTAVIAEYAPLSEYLKSGKLRALAVTSKTRIASLPSVPTVAETYSGFEVDFWWGVFAPRKTPEPKVVQLSGWFKSALEDPQLKEKLISLGFFPTGICGQDFAALLKKQFDDYGQVISAAGLKAE
jgi:tripartite-type tricarboxylate transporter receptor subunit TctC